VAYLIFSSGRVLSETSSRQFDVCYGGFSISGQAGDFEVLFPYVNRLSQRTDESGYNIFQEKFRKVFQMCAASGGNFSLKFGKVSDDGSKMIFAFAFTDERVSVEKVADVYKCCINLGGDLMILDFDSMKIVGCEPLLWELIQAFDAQPTKEQIEDCILKCMDFEELFIAPIRNAFSRLEVRDFSRSSLGIQSVTIDDAAIEFLSPTQQEHLDGYKRWIADQYKSFLCSELNAAVLPYGEKGGAVTIRMADRFLNTERLSFFIEPPTYGIALTLLRFKKVLAEETASQRMLLYGAYIQVSVEGTSFDETIKKGLPKIVPQSMSDADVDDISAYQETLKNLLFKSTDVMRENKKFRKGVLKKCERKS
jgi:hypothetical protein